MPRAENNSKKKKDKQQRPYIQNRALVYTPMAVLRTLKLSTAD